MDFWIDNPKLLFQAKYIREIWIYPGMTENQKLNALTRLIIVLSLIGYVCFNRSLFIVFGLLLIAGIVIFHKQEPVKEGMTGQPIQPSNPLNNILVSDYQDRPYVKPYHPEYSSKIEDDINTSALSAIFLQNKDNADIQKGFGNASDQMEFEQSMRPFHTNPVNTIDKVEYKDFLEFCFGNLPSEKPLTIY
jgi:hypothetical protein